MKEVKQEEVSNVETAFDVVVVVALWLVPTILTYGDYRMAYFGLFASITVLLFEKKSAMVRNHAGQVLILSIVEIIVWGLFYEIYNLILPYLISDLLQSIYSANPAQEMYWYLYFGILFFKLLPVLIALIACSRGLRFKEFKIPVIGVLGVNLSSWLKLPLDKSKKNFQY